MESPISQTQGNSVLFQTSENVQNSNSFDNFSSDVTNFAENVLNYLDDDGFTYEDFDSNEFQESISNNQNLSPNMDFNLEMKPTIPPYAYSTLKPKYDISSTPPSPPYKLRILGVPESSRVETQLKICIQLQNQEGENITNWRYLLLSDYLIGKKYPKSDEKIKIESSISLLLEAGVICASDPSKRIFRCLGCVQRERKNEERKKKNQMETNDSNFSVEKEQEKLLQIYCNPILDFSHGEVIIPSRITCYCRHHDEKEGFRIWVKLRDLSSNSVIASEVSSVVLITDNHKTAKNVTAPTKAMKRPRLTQEVHSDDDLGLPEIEKIIPNEGSINGGIEVTILGNYFSSGLKVLFGASESRTEFWGTKTLVSTLPPATTPGPVIVSLKDVSNNQQEEIIFTYKDDSERMMLELALQVVGMKLTGKLNDPKSIAMSIVNNNQESFKKALQYQKNKSPSDQTLQDCIINALHAISFIFNSNPLNLSLQNERGQTLLILSVILGYHNLTRFLLQNKVNVNLADNNGFTALHWACFLGYQGMVSLLLPITNLEDEDKNDPIKPKPSLDLLTKNGKSALQLAHLEGHKGVTNFIHRYKRQVLKLDFNDEDEMNISSPKDSMFHSLDSSIELKRRKFSVDSLIRTLKYYLISYRAFLIVGLIILLGGIGIFEVLPLFLKGSSSTQLPQTGVVSPSPSPSRFEEPLTNPNPSKTPDYSNELETAEEHRMASTAVLLYSGLSFCMILCLLRRYRAAQYWKIKVVCFFLLLVFLFFIFFHIFSEKHLNYYYYHHSS